MNTPAPSNLPACNLNLPQRLSMSSASSKATSVASSLSASLSSALPSATAAGQPTSASQTSMQTIIIITTIVITTTTLLGTLAGVYYSGYADDILEAAAKKYYSVKAQAEATALANTGSEKGAKHAEG